MSVPRSQLKLCTVWRLSVDQYTKMSDRRISLEIMHLGDCRAILKGSFVIAAICKDGIVLASESRANIFDKTDENQEPIAYYNGIQKIFPVGSAAMAETGQGLILNVFFSTIVSQFTQELRVDLRVNQLLPAFISYCEQRLPPSAVSEVKRQKLFSAGYIESHATICYFNQDQPDAPFGCIQDSGFIQSDITLLTEYAQELPTMPANKVMDLAIEAIETYAAKAERWKTIGGPIDVLLVSEKGCRWLGKNSPTKDWKYIQDLIIAYRAGELEINLIPPADREQLENLLATVPERKPDGPS